MMHNRPDVVCIQPIKVRFADFKRSYETLKLIPAQFFDDFHPSADLKIKIAFLEHIPLNLYIATNSSGHIKLGKPLLPL